MSYITIPVHIHMYTELFCTPSSWLFCAAVLDENLGQIWVVNLAIPLNLRQAGTVPHTYVDSQSTGLVTISCDPFIGCQVRDMSCQLLQIHLEPHLVHVSESKIVQSARLLMAIAWLELAITLCATIYACSATPVTRWSMLFTAGILPLLVWHIYIQSRPCMLSDYSILSVDDVSNFPMTFSVDR